MGLWEGKKILGDLLSILKKNLTRLQNRIRDCNRNFKPCCQLTSNKTTKLLA